MEPVFGELLACECFSLCDFVLMVGEEIIDPTHMDVNLISEKMMITRTTLDMPSRSTRENSHLSIDNKFSFPLIRAI